MMASSMSRTYDTDECLLDPIDQEMFSLFLQYPEIDFDREDTSQDADDSINADEPTAQSSPVSPDTNRNFEGTTLNNDSGIVIDSTLETPIRSTQAAVLEDPETHDSERVKFVQLMEESDLPQECLQYFRFLEQGIADITTELYTAIRHARPSTITHIAQWLLKNIRYSSSQVLAQCERICDLKTLFAFTVKPTAAYVWSTYMQRARLITSNLSLPSKSELNILRSLVFIYDSHICNRFLPQYQSSAVDEQVVELLNNTYDELMSWLHAYGQWTDGIQELRNNCMKPLIGQLVRTPEAQDEFRDFRERIAKAKTTLTKSVGDKIDLTDKVVQVLNLSARKPDGTGTCGLKRSKTRYKREHTFGTPSMGQIGGKRTQCRTND